MALSPQLFAIFNALVEERTGLHHSLENKEIFAEKITTRALEAGYESLLDYYYFLRYDAAAGPELDALIDALVVGETYFFRELQPIEVLVDDFLVPAAREGKRLRLWSAACSTGEEPLTLAMLLADRGIADRVELVASDISPRALARARRGVYGRRSLRGVGPPELIARWIENRGDELVVKRELIDSIQWNRANLLDRDAVARLGSFDAILCRNVMIYFRDETARKAIEHLHDALAPGGLLLVGVAESLLRFSTNLTCEEHRGAFFYRRER